VYAVTGIVAEEFGCYSIDAERLEKLPIVEDARYREVAWIKVTYESIGSLN